MSPPTSGPVHTAMFGSMMETIDAGQRYERVRKALEGGADPNEQTQSSAGTVLGEAVLQKEPRLVELLLKHGADPYLEEKDSSPGSPMRIAAGEGDAQIVRLMLKYGGPPKHALGKMPLVTVAANIEVAKLLMPPKEMMGWRHRRGASLLTYHVSANRYDVVKLLLEAGADEALKADSSELATGDPKMLRLLLDHGANPNAGWETFSPDVVPSRTYAVIANAVRRHYKTLPILLQAGADPDVKGVNGWTALHRASYHGDVEIVKILIAGKASPTSKDEIGRTPLHLAVIGDSAIEPYGDRTVQGERGSLPTVKALLDAGAKIDAEDVRGQTPLFRAATADNRPVVKLLLARGANPRHRDQEGRTAAIVAKELGRPEVVAMLEAGR